MFYLWIWGEYFAWCRRRRTGLSFSNTARGAETAADAHVSTLVAALPRVGLWLLPAGLSELLTWAWGLPFADVNWSWSPCTALYLYHY